MAHIDTLQMYKEYIVAGYTEEQAITAVKSLNSAFDNVATKSDLAMLEKDLKYFFITTFLGLIYAPIIVAAILRFFGKI